ncbi:hypothetical protein [Halosimplex pelagicum]|uniref:Uncharacterized protein n=1 Tax=Halosimplex pelagicum TaxID=869886 RepID=A0A7D5TCF4_9EURY|nr:hypothetical protein [Halosimplex pelagicum]QLH81995.1 hypothetical protein HZS54_10355 [Halosimplex pelagicum]
MSGGGREAALKYLCQHRASFKFLFAGAVTFLLFHFVSLTVVEPGTPSYVITVVNIVSLGVLLVISLVVIIGCQRFAEQDK